MLVEGRLFSAPFSRPQFPPLIRLNLCTTPSSTYRHFCFVLVCGGVKARCLLEFLLTSAKYLQTCLMGNVSG